MKTFYHKLEPKMICCRDYMHFNRNSFRVTILRELKSNKTDLESFISRCAKTFYEQAPTKKNMHDGSMCEM